MMVSTETSVLSARYLIGRTKTAAVTPHPRLRSVRSKVENLGAFFLPRARPAQRKLLHIHSGLPSRAAKGPRRRVPSVP